MEKILRKGAVYRCDVEGHALQGMRRLLHFEHSTNSAWFIKVSVTTTDASGVQGQKVEGIRSYPLEVVRTALDSLELVVVPWCLPAEMALPESALIKKYSTSRQIENPLHGLGLGYEDEPKKLPWPIAVRNQRFLQIEFLLKVELPELVKRGTILRLINEKNLQASKPKLYALLYTYLAFGNSRNSLIPHADRMGAPGKERIQKQRIGRKPIAVVEGDVPEGFVMSEESKAQIALGYKALHTSTSTLLETYLKFCKVFYAEQVTASDGKESVVLQPAHRRPTFRQFEYWASKGESLSASRIKQGERDWQNNSRPLHGTAADGIAEVGHTAFCDSTPTDVNLVSAFSRLRVIGSAYRIVVMEALVRGYIAGFYLGLRHPSGETALQAILHAALPKREYCQRLGLDIEEDDWIPLMYKRYIVDNGEFKNQKVIAVSGQMQFGVEYVAQGAASLKGPVEGAHRSAHAKSDHKQPGTNFGRQRKRGETPPRVEAALNLVEHTREFVRFVIHHNTKALVPELLTAQMKRDGVEPTRIAMMRWYVQNGLVHYQRQNHEEMRANLLPEMPCVITSSGILLCRADRGAKTEYISRARFVSRELIETGLVEQARKSGNIRTTCLVDPESTREIWFSTPQGLLKVPNAHDDPVVVSEASLADLMDEQDVEVVVRSRGQSKADQDELDLIQGREATSAQAKAEKSAEIAKEAAGTGKSTKEVSIRIDNDSIRENRRLEHELTSQQAVYRDFPSLDLTPQAATAEQPQQTLTPAQQRILARSTAAKDGS